VVSTTRTDPLRILVVDDDDADAFMIEEVLAQASLPVTVQRARDGREALDLLGPDGGLSGAERPDLILLDLNMPRMDGRQTLAEVKNDPALRAIPVIVLTTSGAPPDVLASYRHHANAYVTKPIDLEEFESVVSRISRFFGETVRLPRPTA
jgi:CheY-like chemotaxis protein